MEEGEILEWRKKEGERIEKGEVLFVIETEKVTFEVEAGAENSTTRSEGFEEKVRRNFFSLGYRWDF